tara:strand:+ start:1048 stop:2061 length:1014 start_codon:yes stop_codon:yes gene_type:complete
LAIINQRKILLIGGGGYIGTVLAEHLLESRYEVRSLDLFLYQNECCLDPLLNNENFESWRGDLCRIEDLHRALDGVSDVVLLAGLVGDPVTKKYPDESKSINEIGIRQCIDQLSGRGLNRVIFVSTCSNYGILSGEQLATEETELKPISTYAKAKVAAEMHIIGKRDQVDYTPVILRFATAFGLSSRMRFDLTINGFTRELFLNRPLLVYDPHTWRPYCHVKDFARLIDTTLNASVQDVAFETFNAGGEQNNHTKQQIVQALQNHLPKARVNFQEHGSDPRNYRVDFNKVRQILGFEPTYIIEDGITELIQALQSGQFKNADEHPTWHGNHKMQYPA